MVKLFGAVLTSLALLVFGFSGAMAQDGGHCKGKGHKHHKHHRHHHHRHHHHKQ
jgi:hypothetical protein